MSNTTEPMVRVRLDSLRTPNGAAAPVDAAGSGGAAGTPASFEKRIRVRVLPLRVALGPDLVKFFLRLADAAPAAAGTGAAGARAPHRCVCVDCGWQVCVGRSAVVGAGRRLGTRGRCWAPLVSGA